MGTNRKPHSDWAGYRSERRNPHSGGHTVIVDNKIAQEQGNPWVADYEEEGGRYQVICDAHGTNCFTTSMPKAMDLMKDPTSFCETCRSKAEGGAA